MAETSNKGWTRRRAAALLGAMPMLPLSGCGGGGGGSGGADTPNPPSEFPGRLEVARFPVDGGSLVAAVNTSGSDYLLVQGTSPPRGTDGATLPAGDGSTQYWRCTGDARAGNVVALQNTAGVDLTMVAPDGQVYGLARPPMDESKSTLHRWGNDGRRQDLGSFLGSGVAGCGPRLVANNWIASDKAAFQISTSVVRRMPDNDVDDSVPTASWVRYWGDGTSSTSNAPSRVFFLKNGRITCLSAGRPYLGFDPARLYEYDLASGNASVVASDAVLNHGWPQADGERAAWVRSASLFAPSARDFEVYDLLVAQLDSLSTSRQVARGVGKFSLSGGTLAWQQGVAVARQGGAASPTPSSIWVDDGSTTGLKIAEGVDLVLAGAGHGAVVWTAASSPGAQATPGSWIWTRSGGTRKIAGQSIGTLAIVPGRLYFTDGHGGEARVIYRFDF